MSLLKFKKKKKKLVQPLIKLFMSVYSTIIWLFCASKFYMARFKMKNEKNKIKNYMITSSI